MVSPIDGWFGRLISGLPIDSFCQLIGGLPVVLRGVVLLGGRDQYRDVAALPIAVFVE